MIQVISLKAAEEAVSGLSKMQEIVCPLFADVALYDTREQNWESVHGKQETEGCGHEKERKDVLQLTADVPAVKRSLMMFPMKRIEPLVKKAAN